MFPCSHCSEKFKIHYLLEVIVIIKFVLQSYRSETHFPYKKKIVIAHVGETPVIVFLFCLTFLGLWLSTKLLM